jgi:hypothetical protein
MRLVGRRIEPQLHGANNPAVEACREKNGIAGHNAGFDLVEETARLSQRKRRHEIDAGAACNTINENFRKFVERAVANRRRE